MTQVNIITIFVRKNETTQIIGFIIVKNVVILHISNVFLGEFLNTKDGDYRNIKFGSPYLSTIHQHLLTLVQETMDVSHCNNCCRPCKDIAYACATCNISFDWQCASIKWENEITGIQSLCIKDGHCLKSRDNKTLPIYVCI